MRDAPVDRTIADIVLIGDDVPETSPFSRCARRGRLTPCSSRRTAKRRCSAPARACPTSSCSTRDARHGWFRSGPPAEADSRPSTSPRLHDRLTETEHVAAAFAAGGADYVTKPIRRPKCRPHRRPHGQRPADETGAQRARCFRPGHRRRARRRQQDCLADAARPQPAQRLFRQSGNGRPGRAAELDRCRPARSCRRP